MEFLKYVTKERDGIRHAVIVPKNCSHSLSIIKECYQEALLTFPLLAEENCNVSRIKNTGYIDGHLGFEFRIPSVLDSIPKDFFEIDHLFSY